MSVNNEKRGRQSQTHQNENEDGREDLDNLLLEFNPRSSIIDFSFSLSITISRLHSNQLREIDKKETLLFSLFSLPPSASCMPITCWRDCQHVGCVFWTRSTVWPSVPHIERPVIASIITKSTNALLFFSAFPSSSVNPERGRSAGRWLLAADCWTTGIRICSDLSLFMSASSYHANC